MGASREEIAAEAMNANNAYERARRQITELETLSQVQNNNSPSPKRFIFLLKIAPRFLKILSEIEELGGGYLELIFHHVPRHSLRIS